MNPPKLLQLSEQIVYRSEAYGSNYNSFPSAVLTPDGKIVVVFRQARDLRHIYGETRHLDSHSRAVFVTSADGGRTWDEPHLLYDHYIYGVQDPCINLLKDGSLLVTFFMWMVLDRETAGAPQQWDAVYYNEWVGRFIGLYTIRSCDNGASWDTPRPVHPPTGEKLALRGKCVELADGSIIAPAIGSSREFRGKAAVYVMKSNDRGASWEHLSVIEHPYSHVETSFHLTPSGKIVCFSRSDNFVFTDPTTNPLLTCESLDGGLTWSEVIERPFCSPGPFDAIRLQSGKVLVTWGRRFPPFGIRAFLLDAECTDWNNAEEIVLRDNCDDEDIGYTSSVQLPDGEIMTFYYYMDNESGGYRYIAASRYSFVEPNQIGEHALAKESATSF